MYYKYESNVLLSKYDPYFKSIKMELRRINSNLGILIQIQTGTRMPSYSKGILKEILQDLLEKY